MRRNVVVSSTKPTSWSRSTSVGSSSTSSNTSSTSSMSSSSTTVASAIPSPPSSELCALIGFAYQLGSTVQNSDIHNMDGTDSDVRREAKLLMSLSCSSPSNTDDERTGLGDGNVYSIHNSNNNDHNNNNETWTAASTLQSSSSISSSSVSSSGRITPTHSVTSISSGGSRRDTFCFTCPSLSLDKRGDAASPGTMLSRTLKVDDKDAMRLSSEAMARNIIESFQKAIVWRIQSWVESLSRVLVVKEIELKSLLQTMEAKQAQQVLREELYFSKEALLIKTLKEIEGKVRVLEATTAFKVLNKVSQVDETGSALKKRRKGDEEEDRKGLGEGEYVYDVIHILEMQCSLNISTPAGNVRVDLNVPGKIKGTFFSSEDEECDDKLTDVTIDLNTEMVASMIEKSSRIAVRASTEALLKGDPVSEEDAKTNQEKEATATKTTRDPQEISKPPVTATTALPTRSPKRKADDSNVSGLVVITPARNTTSSPSSFGESSDSDGDQPFQLQIPASFPATKKILQASKTLDFAARLPPKKYMKKKAAAVVVTPLKTKGPEYISREKGPNLPILMETASFQK